MPGTFDESKHGRDEAGKFSVGQTVKTGARPKAEAEGKGFEHATVVAHPSAKDATMTHIRHADGEEEHVPSKWLKPGPATAAPAAAPAPAGHKPGDRVEHSGTGRQGTFVGTHPSGKHVVEPDDGGGGRERWDASSVVRQKPPADSAGVPAAAPMTPAPGSPHPLGTPSILRGGMRGPEGAPEGGYQNPNVAAMNKAFDAGRAKGTQYPTDPAAPDYSGDQPSRRDLAIAKRTGLTTAKEMKAPQPTATPGGAPDQPGDAPGASAKADPRGIADAAAARGEASRNRTGPRTAAAMSAAPETPWKPGMVAKVGARPAAEAAGQGFEHATVVAHPSAIDPTMTHIRHADGEEAHVPSKWLKVPRTGPTPPRT